MPKITILEKRNLQEDCWHSMLISLLRGLAALQVAAAHLRALVYPGFGTAAKPPLLFQGLAFSTGFAYLAVIVFSSSVAGSSVEAFSTNWTQTGHFRVTRSTESHGCG